MDNPFELAAAAGPDLVIAVGLIIALIFALQLRPRLGAKASQLTAIGLAVLALGQIAGVAMTTVGYRMIYDLFDGSPSFLISVYSLLSRVFWVTGLALLIAAIFVRRPVDPARDRRNGPPAAPPPSTPSAARTQSAS